VLAIGIVIRLAIRIVIRLTILKAGIVLAIGFADSNFAMVVLVGLALLECKAEHRQAGG
jgi:hypothetical protein